MYTTNDNLKNSTIRGTSMNRTSKETPYTMLADAIVLLAAMDVRDNNCHADSAKEFLNSEWCNELSNVDGKYILKKLQEAA